MVTRMMKQILVPQTRRYHYLHNHQASIASGYQYLVSSINPSIRRRFSAVTGVDALEGYSSGEDSNQLHFPGGKIGYIPELRSIQGSDGERVPCYRVLDEDGSTIHGSQHAKINREMALKMYRGMVTLQVMDNVFYESQRQGRLSFYLTVTGEEAVNMATAAALSPDDVVFAQYREPGVLLWRGFGIPDFACQLFSTCRDLGKGKQMPIHYGSNQHNFFTISSPLATQLPQAVGAAYSLKMHNPDACAVAFTGDGATSEGDFHAALNFASVLDVPVVFICRNNGFAISTQTSDQFRSDGVVVKGPAYGIESVRVDGNDAVAVYTAVAAARAAAISEQKPILVEAMTYRAGHHSTSDDSTKYRSVEEIDYWKTERDPVTRFRKWVEMNGWWDATSDSELRVGLKSEVVKAMQEAEKFEKPPLSEMFTDVYDRLTKDLKDQKKHLFKFVQTYPHEFPADVPIR